MTQDLLSQRTFNKDVTSLKWFPSVVSLFEIMNYNENAERKNVERKNAEKKMSKTRCRRKECRTKKSRKKKTSII